MVRIASVALVLLLWSSAQAFSKTDVASGPRPITSYAGNFLVMSSDPAAASWAAREAEQMRERVLDEFQWKQKWSFPLLLRVEFLPASDPGAMIFLDEADGRKKILAAIVARVCREPAQWLRSGLLRYFSMDQDFHPDRLRTVKSSGKWLSLRTLVERKTAFTDLAWQDVYERESACLILFLKKKHAPWLSAFRAGKGNTKTLAAIEQQWLDWMEAAPRLMPMSSTDRLSLPALRKALARCLGVRIRDEASGKIMTAVSITVLDDLALCCRKTLARRKLLSGYDELLQLSRMDDTRVSLAQDYVECANKIFAGKKFYETFQALEQRRMSDANTVNK